MKIATLAATSFLSMLAVSPMAIAENPQHLNQLFSANKCRKCDLRGAGLVFNNLTRADLSETDLSDANLSRANLSNSILKKTNLSRSSLLGANLTGADLTGADLSGADLNNTDFSGANLTGANLTGADLRRALFVNAKMDGVKFDDAYMRGAVGLPSTALRAEDFQAWGVEEAQRGNHRAAIEQFNNAIAVDPKLAHAYMWRAMSRGQLGDRAGAIEDAQAADKLYEADDNKKGQKSAKDLVAAMQVDPNAGNNDWFGSFLNGVGMTLFQMLLH